MTDMVALAPTPEQVEKEQRMSRGLADAPPNFNLTGPVTGGYFYRQEGEAERWTISHGLGRYPQVTVQTTGELDEYGYVRYVDLNTISIRFSEPVMGWAELR